MREREKMLGKVNILIIVSALVCSIIPFVFVRRYHNTYNTNPKETINLYQMMTPSEKLAVKGDLVSLMLAIVFALLSVATIILVATKISKNEELGSTKYIIFTPSVSLIVMVIARMINCYTSFRPEIMTEVKGKYTSVYSVKYIMYPGILIIIALMIVSFILSIMMTTGYGDKGTSVRVTVDNADSKPANKETNTISNLKEYKDLLDSGIITQEEFDKKKQELLSK